MKNRQIDTKAKKIAKDYSNGTFLLHEMNKMYQDLILWFAEWHIKNTPKKKKLNPVYHINFCESFQVNCDGINCRNCERVFNAAVKFIKEQEEKCTKQ